MRTLRSLSLGAAVPALAALAACTDAPTTPSSSLLPAVGPAKSLGGVPQSGVVAGPPALQVSLALSISGQIDAVVGPTTVDFSTSDGAYKRTVVDNGNGDTDARLGFFSVKMPKALAYTATVTDAPEAYSVFQATKTGGAFFTPTSATLGNISLWAKPSIWVSLVKDGKPYPGQTIEVTNNGYTVVAVITDGGANDRLPDGSAGPADGQIFVRVPAPGPYVVCPKASKASLIQAACAGVNVVNYGLSFGATLTYKQILFP